LLSAVQLSTHDGAFAAMAVPQSATVTVNAAASRARVLMGALSQTSTRVDNVPDYVEVGKSIASIPDVLFSALA
jgi:hypothetical protein